MAQFRFGNFDFPDKFIEYDSVNIKPNQRQSLDPYTDAFGITHDNGVPHTKTEISFTTLPMTNAEYRYIMDNIKANYIDYTLRDAEMRYYDDENGVFKTGLFYLDKSLIARRKQVDDEGIPTDYGEMTWTFIEY
ncbi:MAG: hypothetical protein NC430_12245 [bacterium]|nr:hypothetical protein [bacterium]MCM1424835.1 hypothetical protein [bacterium]